MARPKKYEANDKDRALVAALAGLGYSAEDILSALSMEISRRTLERHYKDEMRTARLKTVVSIGQSLQRKALNPDAKDQVGAASTWLHYFGDKPVAKREENKGKLSLADLMREIED